MVNVRLILDKDEKGEREYILKRLSYYPTCTIEETKHKNLITLDIASEMKGFRSVIRDIVSSVITIFYKYKFMHAGITLPEDPGLEYSAFFGALLSFDLDEEKEKIERKLYNLRYISLKGLYNFALDKLVEGWSAMAVLANRLLSQCKSKEDILELVFFLLAVDSDFSPKVRLDNADTNEIFSDDVKVPIPNLTGDFDKDAIIAIVRERPLSIVLTEPSCLSHQFVNAIKGLSE
jgi:hypothetical protein